MHIFLTILFILFTLPQISYAQSELEPCVGPDCPPDEGELRTPPPNPDGSRGGFVTLNREEPGGGFEVPDVGNTVAADCDDPLGKIRDLGYESLVDYQRAHRPLKTAPTDSADWRSENAYGDYDYDTAGQFTAALTTAKCRSIVFYQFTEHIFLIWMGVAILIILYTAIRGTFDWKRTAIFVGGSGLALNIQTVANWLT